MSTDYLVEVENLERVFKDVKAVDRLSFGIVRGSVTGFIGANGAGKTTTMRILATLDKPDGGSVRIDGIDALGFPNRVRRGLGWMPDNYGAYPNMTVFDYIDFFARAYGLRSADRATRVREVMDFTDLSPIADREIDKLSKGMGQRLCLGRTLLNDPDLLILDEPAAGLDPKARIEFKNLVAQLRERGKTILISSHILSELGEMCDALLFIDRGRLVHQGSSEDLLNNGTAGPVFLVRVAGSPVGLYQWAERASGVELLTRLPDGARIRRPDADPEQTAALLRMLVMDGIPVSEFEREERRLEDAFVDLVKQQNAAALVTPTP